MSKAFTSESDEDPWIEPPALPPGVKNYMTPEGEAALRRELQQLQAEAHALSNDVASANRRTHLERRLQFLLNRLESAVVVAPSAAPAERVRFGCRVTVTEAQGQTETWQIVGIDEADLSGGRISWISPLAEALLGKRAGDTVLFRSRQLTIVSIT